MNHRDYECPVCGEWIEILPTTPKALTCPWCKEPLKLSVDVDNYGMSNQRDLTRLISNRQHIEKMIEHAETNASIIIQNKRPHRLVFAVSSADILREHGNEHQR